MADEYLKVTFTADSAPFDKAAAAVQKGADKTEAAMEKAAATADAASKKLATSVAVSGDAAAASADKISKKFGNLFGEGALPAQAAVASSAIQSVAKAAETSAVAADTHAKAHTSWANTVAAAATRLRDTMSAALGAVGKAATGTGNVVAAAGGVIGSAGMLMGNSLANAAAKGNAAAAVHQRASLAVSAAWAAAAAAVALSVNRAVTEASQITNLSQLTGASTADLQRLKFAVEQTGGTFAGLTAAVKSYGETLNEAATEPTSKAASALRLMGVDLRDGTTGAFKDFNTLLLDVADKFRGYQDGASKAALGQAIFKGSFDTLLPLLNKGADGIRQLGIEAERTGAVWDAAMIQKLEEQHRGLQAFTSALTRLGAELAAILPKLTEFVDWATSAAQKLKASFANPLDEVQQLKTGIASITAEIEALNKHGAPLINRLIGETTETMLANAEARLSSMQAKLSELQGQDRPKFEVPINRTDEWNTKVVPPDLNVMKAQRDEVDDFISRLQGLPVLMGESFAFDAKPFEQAMQKVIAAEQAGALATRDATRMKMQLKKQEQDVILDTASLAASTLTAVFGQSKLAGIASAIVNTAVGVTKALSSAPPPWNFIQAGLVAAAGAAQIATIRSTSETGGGSVAPVSAAGAAAPAEQATQQQTLFVEGINPNGLFTGDVVKSLADRLLQYQRDGGRVVLS